MVTLCFAQSAKKSVPVKRFEIFGTEHVSKGEVEKWFDLENTTLNEEILYKKCLEVLRNYAAHDFPFAKIDSVVYNINPDSSSASVKLYVTENIQIKFNGVGLSGIDSSKAAEIKSRFDTRPGRQFEPEKFINDMDDALGQLENQGYPFTRFELKSSSIEDVSPSTGSIGIDMNTVLGPRLIVNEIQIGGNDLTKDNVILREIRINKGDVYDQRKVDKIPQRLMKLGYFDQVTQPQVFLTEGQSGGLIINVKEGNASKFDGILGYNPGTDTEGGYFTGQLDISLGNLLGTGRSLLAHWEKRDRETQGLQFHYREPWLAGLPLHAGFGFEQLIQDTTYVQRDIAVDFAVPIFENMNILTRLNRSEISPDSMGSYIRGIPRSRTLNASIGIEYDSRDDLINPQAGAYYNTFVQTGKKENLGPDDLVQSLDLRKDIDNKRFSLDAEFYAPLFKRQVLAIGVHGRQIHSNEEVIPVPDLYRLGGTKSLRGYREDQFFGSSVAWTNVELRYILGRRSRAFVFIDSGYYSSKNGNIESNKYKVGYGFGFRLETGLGIMGVDYGLGDGDGLFNGKVHVGLINEF